MTLLESRTESLYWAKQSAKGSPASAADKLGRKVGGDINVNRNDGSENYSDGTRFGDAQQFVDTLIGEGSPVLQAQAGVAGHLVAMLLGAESVSAAGPNYDHVATPGTAGYWQTVWKKVGASVGPLRQKFNDCRLVSLRIEGSTANKVVKVTPQWTSMDPGEIFVTDPVKVDDGDKALLFTEGSGRYTIDGTVFRGESSFAIVISDGVTPAYGDAVTPFDVGFGIATVTLEAITISLDNQALQRYYNQIYGTTAPAVGAKPLQTQPGLGSYTADLRKGQSVTVAITGTPTGGTWVPTVNGTALTAIAYNATAATVQTALEAAVGVGNVTVTGGPGPGTAWQVVFLNYGTTLTVSGAGLTGGSSPAATATDNGHNRGIKIEVPGVAWHPDLAIAGNPDGGNTELPLAADARAVTGQPRIRITTRSGDSSAY
jgi:hypothetical protein